MLLSERSAHIEQILRVAGLDAFGRVWDSSRAIDLALRTRNQKSIVVRCVDYGEPVDHLALRTMIAEGDFDRAFLVHTGDETDLTGEVQTWPLSRIDELAALLAKESAP